MSKKIAFRVGERVEAPGMSIVRIQTRGHRNEDGGFVWIGK